MLNLSAYPLAVNGVATRVLVSGESGMPVVDLSVGKAAAGVIPGARLVVLPDAGHAPYLE
jgi:pimeloyl-ACP methyl ester carboxylesterase